MKGLIRTSVLMQAVLDRDTGIRTGELVTHLMFYEPAGYKLLCLTDGGIVLGAQAPIALVSRADIARSKLTSMALGCIFAD